MKLYILLIIFISSCFGNPVEPKQDGSDKLKVIWNHSTKNIDVPRSKPLIINNSSIIYSGEIELVSLNNIGEEIWRGQIDGERALESKYLLFDGINNRIVSNHYESFKVWDSATGEIIYTLNNENGILAFRLGRNTLVDGGYAFVGDTLDAYVINSDGSLRFKIDVPFGTTGVGYYQGKIYLGKTETVHGGLTLGRIQAFTSQTGDSLWTYNTENSGFEWTAPIVEDGIVYAGAIGNSPDDEVVALDAQTGALIWRQTDYVWTWAMALGPKHVYINTGGSLAALDKTDGSIVWRVEWLGTDWNQPVYLQGYVYHVRDSELLVIDDNNGEVVHREPVPEGGRYFWHVAASTDNVFAQTSRQLIAYEPWHVRD